MRLLFWFTSKHTHLYFIIKYFLQFAIWKNAELEQNFDLILRVVTELRNVKVEYGLAKSKPEGIK
jgi:hypothetical protein